MAHPDTATESSNQPESRIKRVELWTAVIVLVVTVVSGVVTILTQFKPVTAALESKPLEGIYDYSISYTRFHSQDGAWSGDGKALIVWKRDQSQYEIYFGAEINKSGEAAPVLAGFSKGYIPSDAAGWPADGFTINDIRYIARMHSAGTQPAQKSYEYKQCHFEKKGERAEKITGDFETPLSKGSIRFKWSAPLH